MVFQKELKKLGLKDKEASVYVACLELGPASVQQVSRKAKVVRATTYVVLDSLAERGLVTQYKEGKKTLFSAEPPRQLLRLLEKREEEISQYKHELEQLLPELQMIVKSGDDRPHIRYFDGKEGLHSMRQEIVRYSEPGEEILNFTPLDHLSAIFAEREDSFYKQRTAKRIRSKTIFTTKSVKQKEKMFAEIDKANQRRFIEPEKFPSPSGMTIYRDRIAIGSFTGKIGGVVIESPTMAAMMRNLFELAWHSAENSAS